MEQVCNRCGVAKLLNRENFYNNAKRPNGFEPTCIPCRKAARKATPSYGKQYYGGELKDDPTAFVAEVFGYRVPQIQGARVVDMDRAGNGRRMVGWTVHE